MKSLSTTLGALLAVFLIGLVPVTAPAGHAATESPSVRITGDYRYAYHDPETAAQAQDIACREALRLAVSTAAPVREQVGSVVDPTLFRQLVHTLAGQHVTDYQILEQFQKGKTVYCKVSAALQPETVASVFLAQTHTAIETKGASPLSDGSGLDRNRVLQLLAVEEQDGTIVVTYQSLRRLDWSTTAYDGSLQGLADVMVDFYDSEGILIRTVRHPARRTLAGDDVMQPGQIGVLKVPRPLNTKSYRVWLVK
ncbi:MAG TPA: hypothetical protein VJ805_13275 [Nitrospiraceae bacterium]|nr:hypothetical protein [Nitrospiraceae bacterium]